MRLRFLVMTIISLFLSAAALQGHSDSLYPVVVGSKYGFCDCSGNMRIEASYDYVGYFRDGKTAVVGCYNNAGVLLKGIINNDGNLIVPCEFFITEGEGMLWGGEDGFYSIENPVSGLIGYYDIRNSFFCEPKYYDVDINVRDKKGMLVVIDAENHLSGLIRDSTGEPIVECKYLCIYTPNDGLAIGVTEDGYWIISSDRKVLKIKDRYIPDNLFQKELLIALIVSENYYCLLNRNGEQMTLSHYELIWYDENMGYYVGRLNDKDEIVLIETAR